MAGYFFQAFLLAFPDQSDQVRNIGMNVAVGKKSEEVHLAVVFLGKCNSLLPGSCLINFSAFNGFIDKLCALRINLAAAKCVMTDFRVAHILICRQANCCTGCLDCSMRPFCHELINLWFVSMHYCIAVVFVCPADTIHDDQNYWFSHIFCNLLFALLIIPQ